MKIRVCGKDSNPLNQLSASRPKRMSRFVSIAGLPTRK